MIGKSWVRIPKTITIGKITKHPTSNKGRLTRPRLMPKIPKISFKNNFISGMPTKMAPMIKSKVIISSSF